MDGWHDDGNMTVVQKLKAHRLNSGGTPSERQRTPLKGQCTPPKGSTHCPKALCTSQACRVRRHLHSARGAARLSARNVTHTDCAPHASRERDVHPCWSPAWRVRPMQTGKIFPRPHSVGFFCRFPSLFFLKIFKLIYDKNKYIYR